MDINRKDVGNKQEGTTTKCRMTLTEDKAENNENQQS